MVAYYKILQNLLCVKILGGTYSKRQPTDTVVVFTKNDNNFYSGNQLLSSIYSSLNVLKMVSNVTSSSVLFVGSSREHAKFAYFFNHRLKRTLFITRWLNGLLTNWSQLVLYANCFQMDAVFLEKSKRLRFFRFFFSLRNREKPSVVVFFDSENNPISLFRECFFEAVPIISVIKKQERQTVVFTTYSLFSNTHTFFSHWFFFQLFFLQVRKNGLLLFFKTHCLYAK